MTRFHSKNLNYFSEKELLETELFSEKAAKLIVESRKDNHYFSDLDDLLSIKEISETDLEKIISSGYYVFNPVVESPEPFPEPTVTIKNSFFPSSFLTKNASVVNSMPGMFPVFPSVLWNKTEVYPSDPDNSPFLPDGTYDNPLQPLRPGENRKLSDALCSKITINSGYMHPPIIDGNGRVTGAGLGYGYFTIIQTIFPPSFCAYVWILLGRRDAAGNIVGSSPLAAGATGNGPVKTPAPAQTDKVVEDFRESNTILSQCGIQFSICGIYVIDPNQMPDFNNPNGKLADRIFNNNGEIKTDRTSDPNQDVLNSLQLYLRQNPSPIPNFRYDPKCAHIFYVKEVEDRNPPLQTGGVGKPVGGRSQMTPCAIIEGGGKNLAHELGHGMDEPHIDDPGRERRPGEPPFNRRDPNHRDNFLKTVNSGTKVTQYQCSNMKKFVQKNIRKGCP